MSITAHIGVAAFLASLHETTLAWLTKFSPEENKGLSLARWHDIMERRENYKTRQKFFSEVVEKAAIVCPYRSAFVSKPLHLLSDRARSGSRHATKRHESPKKY
jgi:hypothetical protein